MVTRHQRTGEHPTETPRCQHCGHVLTAHKSVQRLAGPICLRRNNGQRVAA